MKYFTYCLLLIGLLILGCSKKEKQIDSGLTTNTAPQNSNFDPEQKKLEEEKLKKEDPTKYLFARLKEIGHNQSLGGSSKDAPQYSLTVNVTEKEIVIKYPVIDFNVAYTRTEREMHAIAANMTHESTEERNAKCILEDVQVLLSTILHENIYEGRTVKLESFTTKTETDKWGDSKVSKVTVLKCSYDKNTLLKLFQKWKEGNGVSLKQVATTWFWKLGGW